MLRHTTGPFRALFAAQLALIPVAAFLFTVDAGTGGSRTDPGDTGDAGDEDTDHGDDTGDTDAGEDDLGAAGKQALDRMRDARNAARKELREWKSLGLTATQIRDLAARAGRKTATEGDDTPEVDVDKIKADARAEADREIARERIADKIEAKAARAFADPEDAVALLLRAHEVDDFLDDRGSIDPDTIDEALKDLLEKKPHLAAAAQSRRFQGGADGGTRNGGRGRPTQLTRADLQGMSSEDIEKARLAGKLDVLQGRKS